MGSMNLSGMLELTDRATALAWHLTSNHYPPVPLSMAEPCERAIEALQDDEPKRQIVLPDGITYRGMSAAPAWAVVENYHLGEFLRDDDDD